jgi:hypothetical protein
MVERELLRHHAAQGEAEQVHLREADLLEEGEQVGRHPGDRGGHLSGRASDSGALEQDDLAAAGERVGDGRVPVVQGPGEMLEKDERWGVASAEPAVGVRLEPGLDELGQCRDMVVVFVICSP